MVVLFLGIYNRIHAGMPSRVVSLVVHLVDKASAPACSVTGIRFATSKSAL